jgi:hypothetical protein
MNRHVMDWIPAYTDGELSADRRKQVEEHLESCADCRDELEIIKKLSGLLKEVPGQVLNTPPDVFATRIQRRLPPTLPPRSPRQVWQDFLRAAWQAAPVTLVAGWAFCQAVLFLAGAASLAWLQVNGPAIQVAENRLGGLLHGQALLPGLSLAGWGAWAILVGALWFGITFTTGVLLWGWLASWWAGKRFMNEGDIQWTTLKY